MTLLEGFLPALSPSVYLSVCSVSLSVTGDRAHVYSRHPPNLAINYYLPTFNDNAGLSPDYLAMQELENPPKAGVGCSLLLELGTVNKRHASNEFQAHFLTLLREQYVLARRQDIS